MATRTFNFAGADGLLLSGRLELPATAVRGWALFAHCFTCGKDALAAIRISRALAGAGIGVLRFDFAGVGASEGEFGQTTFASNVADLLAAAAAMDSAGMPPALLIGHSFGGAAVLAAASQILAARAVATIAAPFDVAHILHQFGADSVTQLEQAGEADVRLAGRLFKMQKSFVDDVRQQAQKPRIAGLGRALLVMHAPRDELVAIEQAGAIFAAARHPKSFVSLDSADHLLSRREDADYAAAVIAAWATRYLAKAPEAPSVDDGDDVTAEETGAGRFQVLVKAGAARLLVDEPVAAGGVGSGPTPYDLLSAALAACTTMTLRVYADRNGLPATAVRTCVGYSKAADTGAADLFTRKISLKGPLDEAQRARLLAMAARCPVHLTLERGARIESELGDPPAEASPIDTHARMIERAVAAHGA
jgi:putative redox protein